ncbi:hypothetical protein QBC47DRAFT_358805 [Echria macrotheca]|uniref:Uncharacterized protein n=1 Tax=Echria macrotheca TaxID=438768 RepID=A0AAJ0BGM1_9PEZI|nr:hypothetical protein QBC47DRAFT_358805 [Echria macrotheca]
MDLRLIIGLIVIYTADNIKSYTDVNQNLQEVEKQFLQRAWIRISLGQFWQKEHVNFKLVYKLLAFENIPDNYTGLYIYDEFLKAIEPYPSVTTDTILTKSETRSLIPPNSILLLYEFDGLQLWLKTFSKLKNYCKKEFAKLKTRVFYWIILKNGLFYSITLLVLIYSKFEALISEFNNEVLEEEVLVEWYICKLIKEEFLKVQEELNLNPPEQQEDIYNASDDEDDFYTPVSQSLEYVDYIREPVAGLAFGILEDERF